MLQKIIENFPEGTSETAKRVLTISMRTGEKIGDKLSDRIDIFVDSIFK